MKNNVSVKAMTLFSGLFLTCMMLTGQTADTCYKAVRETSSLWRIVENNSVNIYVVEGKDSALIIDTGYGTGDLKSYIKKLTSLPVIVVNTHGHEDHMGGDKQFPVIYAHPLDFEMIKAGMGENDIRLSPVTEGYVFNLGGRKLEVIEVPGHTKGSICLLDSENKILFAGDNTNGLVWLFLKGCCPLEVYLKSLEKVQQRMDEFQVIMPGHNTPLEKTFISDQVSCVKNILAGNCSPVPYDYASFTQGALLCKYGNAQVAYDPNNLFVGQTE